jgi:membrane-associated phospholipid phosphatase
MRSNRCSRCLFGMALIVLAAAVAAGAQSIAKPTPSPSPNPSPSPSLEHEFFKNILRDQKAIWTSPLHLERSDAKWIIPSGIGFMALATTDRITGDEIGEANRQDNASRIISYAGSIYGLAAVAGTFYFVGREKHDNRARETGLLATEAMIDSAIVEGVLKSVTQRARPADGVERSEFFDGGSSFPSGHATGAWAVATVVANEYHDRLAVQLAAYGIASAVSVARFTGHKHYISDVVAGSALGWGIGRYVYKEHHRETPLITMQFDRRARQYGVGVAWSF